MWRPQFLLLLGLAVLGSSIPGSGSGQEYQVELAGDNRVSFLSDAPLEDFRGVTSRVDGFAFVPGGALGSEGGLSESEFHFEVDLASLDTGLGLRNRHMRENYLETDRFPFATFSGRIGSLRRGAGGVLTVVAEGEFEVHGELRRREIFCRATPEELSAASAEDLPAATPEDLRRNGPLWDLPRLRVQCAFPVTLSDHGIPIPKLMFMKIDEVMEVEVDLHLIMVSGESSPDPSETPATR